MDGYRSQMLAHFYTTTVIKQQPVKLKQFEKMAKDEGPQYVSEYYLPLLILE